MIPECYSINRFGDLTYLGFTYAKDSDGLYPVWVMFNTNRGIEFGWDLVALMNAIPQAFPNFVAATPLSQTETNPGEHCWLIQFRLPEPVRNHRGVLYQNFQRLRQMYVREFRKRNSVECWNCSEGNVFTDTCQHCGAKQTF